MAEPGNVEQAAGGAPNLSVLTQYVKDFSFENPGAPQSLRARQSAPAINISIGVQSAPAGTNEFEVELRIDARAVDGQAVLFAIELVYAGIFRFTNIPAEQSRAVALIECPRLLFPFARQVVSEASRNGGFPPLLIDPVDFVAMYRQQIAQEAGQSASAPN
jgi:preprotein translocase subunit SecB